MNKKNFNKKPGMFSPKGSKNILIGVIFLIACIILLDQLVEYSRRVEVISYSTFLEKVESGQIDKVDVMGQGVYGVFKNGTRFETVIAETPHNWDLLYKNKVEVTVKNPAYTINWLALFFVLSVLIAFVFAAWYFLRQKSGSGGGGGGNPFTMGKNKARMYLPSEIKENFDSVAGAHEAKEELYEVVDFLKNPKKYLKLGARIPRGVLMVGEPGNGKTLLARAVAGEANCPFFSISGSDFIEVFVGVGAARVRDLFAQARRHAPCIIFIDEIDAVGRHRGTGQGGGNDEREQTLNQLLTEMDGFNTTGGTVIVMAATNRPDVLDKALLRPGRFDRRVEVPYPDLQSRLQILQVHAKGVPMDASVDLEKIARGTPGFSGADLGNLINESAILASKNDLKKVTMHEFEQSRDKILLGKESKSIMLTEEDRKVTAYHEAGHALVRLLIPESTDPLHKVTIVPRGRALGVTHSLPEREKYNTSKEEMLASICAALGGRAAEELEFNQLTTGAYSDFKAATNIVRNLVCNQGMTDSLGPIVYQETDSFRYSQATAEKIDNEMRDIMNACYKRAMQLLKDNKDKLDKLSHALLEKETMYAGDIYTLLDIEPRQDYRLT